jgi:hypothetical protein
MTYTKDEPVTITFGTLKQAQNEAFRDGIAYSVSSLRAIGQFAIAEELEQAAARVSLYNEGDEK